MAIGPVLIKAKDADNTTRNIRALSSDGTTGGDLTPAHAVVNAAQAVINPATAEGVAAVAAKLPAPIDGKLPVDIGIGSIVTVSDIGAADDEAATSDGGAFSLIALFKRLLGKFPSLTQAGRVPVDIGQTLVLVEESGVTVTPFAVAQANASLPLLAANPERVSVTIINNDGAVSVPVGLDGHAAAYNTSGTVEIDPLGDIRTKGALAKKAFTVRSTKLGHQLTIIEGFNA